MRRVLLTILSSALLLLALASLGTWVRSYFAYDTLHLRFHSGGAQFWSFRGQCMLEILGPMIPTKTSFYHGSGSPMNFASQSLRWFKTYHEFACFGYGTTIGPRPLLVIPYWFIVIASGLPAFFAWRLLKRKAILSSRCSACGYDLTANTSGICPECGQVIAQLPDPCRPAAPPS